MNNNFLPNRVNVTVNGSVYQIPTEKLGELLGLLSQWQSIQVQQPIQGQTENSKWNGQQLING